MRALERRSFTNELAEDEEGKGAEGGELEEAEAEEGEGEMDAEKAIDQQSNCLLWVQSMYPVFV